MDEDSGQTASPLFTGVNHISVVTSDLDATVRAWNDRYGLGPWELYTYDEAMIDAEVDGEPVKFAMRAGFCRLEPGIRIEIIEPLDDRSPYAASLARHGGANHIHHLRLDVADQARSRHQMEELGLTRPLDGEFAGLEGTSSRATYFDTSADLGFLVEIAAMPDGYVRIEPDGTYP